MLEQIIGERIWNGYLTTDDPVTLSKMAQDLILNDDVITARQLHDGEAVLRICCEAPHRFVVEVYELIDLS